MTLLHVIEVDISFVLPLDLNRLESEFILKQSFQKI